jgi:hypothetical protein
MATLVVTGVITGACAILTAVAYKEECANLENAKKDSQQ